MIDATVLITPLHTQRLGLVQHQLRQRPRNLVGLDGVFGDASASRIIHLLEEIELKGSGVRRTIPMLHIAIFGVCLIVQIIYSDRIIKGKEHTMAATVEEMKELMLQIGMDKELIAGIDPAAPLAGQGVDSVDCPAFAVALEGKYKVTISDSDSMKLRSINDFVAFVNR